MRRMRRSFSSSPSPQSSTPQLFETTSRSSIPWVSRASIRTLGIPHKPNPPTAKELPLTISAIAASGL